ncbi:MAG TPA: cytochrome c biogenesis CcdA family protein [Methylomirabilota bacterium]|jgi:cytochrome c biogenesis protein CcdA|nr:cytochrome c biogenesis CcdA family protein [Methylomirabilota bacterium]
MAACLLGFAAGALGSLSPCVLPLLPVVLAGAVERHRWGPLVLAGGLAVSATAVGFAVALLGFGLDRDLVRLVSAALLVGFGAVLLVARLDVALARATTPLAAGAAGWLARLGPRGLAGQFVVGALLGALWTPCGGPTLGGAISLAARGDSLGASAAVMGAYSLGAVAPLLLLAYGSRRWLARPERLAAASRVAKPAVGAALVLLGVLGLTGADKALEARVLDCMPAWLIELTTRF